MDMRKRRDEHMITCAHEKMEGMRLMKRPGIWTWRLALVQRQKQYVGAESQLK
jgi:hypothetical protein